MSSTILHLSSIHDYGKGMDLLAHYSDSSDELSDQEVVAKPVAEESFDKNGKRKFKFSKAELKRRRKQRKGDGPWGSWDVELDQKKVQDIDDDGAHDLFDSDHDQETANGPSKLLNEKSTFYGKKERDYQGRSYLHPPADVDVDFKRTQFKCYLPKKVIYRYKGHHNGTTSLRLLPGTGHLILSGGNDNTVKLWDFYHDRKCLRDFVGHSKPIKTLDFTSDSSQFLSGSYDQQVKIWDTETGKVTKRLNTYSTPNSAEFRPTSGNEFVVGLSSSKIKHYDTRVSEKDGLVQVYDHHLSSILAIKYFPDGSKFISSSEDKTLRIWNNQVNIPIKQISDTTQHSMPYIGIHPEHNYFSTQSMDSVIYSYSMKPKYKMHPNKKFKGHNSAGYGIGLTFSPDGRFLCSGDARGQLFLWDWNTNRKLCDLKLPTKSPITQVSWHPKETSKVICSGPDGRIFVLD